LTLTEAIDRLTEIRDEHGDGPLELTIAPSDGRATANDHRCFVVDLLQWNLTGGAELLVYDPEWRPRG
jgi:hypothetical protein